MKDGKIGEQGTYEELLQQDGAFAEFIRNYLQEADSEESDSEGMVGRIILILLLRTGKGSEH